MAAIWTLWKFGCKMKVKLLCRKRCRKRLLDHCLYIILLPFMEDYLLWKGLRRNNYLLWKIVFYGNVYDRPNVLVYGRPAVVVDVRPNVFVYVVITDFPYMEITWLSRDFESITPRAWSCIVIILLSTFKFRCLSYNRPNVFDYAKSDNVFQHYFRRW